MERETDEKIISYLTFRIGDEMFATHVSVVLNIIELPRITKVPNTPSYMKGIINLRGMILPVIDSRVKFGLQEIENTKKTCIIVMDIKLNEDIDHVGLLVDEVSEVLLIDDSQIESPPMIGEMFKSSMIKGITKVDERMIMIVDIINLFTTLEMAEISGIHAKSLDVM
ncbi:MAG: chemotaxis protein CheW [Bacteroidales bacterium]